MKIIEAYACDFCKKFTKTKRAMKNHEPMCFRNPAVKACATCVNYVQEEYDVEINGGIDYQYRPVCRRGKSLFSIDSNNPQGYKVKLKNNCELWEEEE